MEKDLHEQVDDSNNSEIFDSSRHYGRLTADASVDNDLDFGYDRDMGEEPHLWVEDRSDED